MHWHSNKVLFFFGGGEGGGGEIGIIIPQLGERQSAEREAVGLNPGRTNTQGL